MDYSILDSATPMLPYMTQNARRIPAAAPCLVVVSPAGSQERRGSGATLAGENEAEISGRFAPRRSRRARASLAASADQAGGSSGIGTSSALTVLARRRLTSTPAAPRDGLTGGSDVPELGSGSDPASCRCPVRQGRDVGPVLDEEPTAEASSARHVVQNPNHVDTTYNAEEHYSVRLAPQPLLEHAGSLSRASTRPTIATGGWSQSTFGQSGRGSR